MFTWIICIFRDASMFLVNPNCTCSFVETQFEPFVINYFLYEAFYLPSPRISFVIFDEHRFFLSALHHNAILSFERGVAGRAVAISAIVYRHLRDVLKEISAKQLSPQFSFLFLRRSFSLDRTFLLFSVSAFLAHSWAERGYKSNREREGTREFGGKKTARRDDRARPVAIISLAATRQMSEHCETRRLVGRFALRFCLSRFRNNITRRNGIITGRCRGTLRAFRWKLIFTPEKLRQRVYWLFTDV